MLSTMQDFPLTIGMIFRHGRAVHPDGQVVTFDGEGTRSATFTEIADRAERLAAALDRLGVGAGDRVATLCWNHHAHLECYFGIPAAGGVMHTLNLRLSPDEIGWIAGHAQDRFLVVDDILLPLYRQFADRHRFERVIVFPFSGAPVPEGFDDYEALLAAADPDRSEEHTSELQSH